MGITAVVSFILYVFARMKEKEQKESRYRSIHFLSLSIFVLLGVLALILLSHQEP